MSRVLTSREIILPEFGLSFSAKLRRLWPVIAPMALAIGFIVARGYVGPRGFLYEGALTMLALISYVSAAVILVTNLFVRDKLLSRMGSLAVAIGICFNFSGWMIHRGINDHQHQNPSLDGWRRCDASFLRPSPAPAEFPASGWGVFRKRAGRRATRLSLFFAD